MPIIAPQLDDLRFDRTVDDLVRRIPVYAPEWTDFNDSDPGITLVQLFAYLAEQVGYRLNRIPEKNHIELLKLLGVRLKPARAATTRLAFLLADPATTVGFTLATGAKAKAKKGNPPPTFETDADIDIVPAEPNLLLVTKNPLLWDLRRTAAGSTDPLGTPPTQCRATTRRGSPSRGMGRSRSSRTCRWSRWRSSGRRGSSISGWGSTSTRRAMRASWARA